MSHGKRAGARYKKVFERWAGAVRPRQRFGPYPAPYPAYSMSCPAYLALHPTLHPAPPALLPIHPDWIALALMAMQLLASQLHRQRHTKIMIVTRRAAFISRHIAVQPVRPFRDNFFFFSLFTLPCHKNMAFLFGHSVGDRIFINPVALKISRFSSF